MFTGIVEELGEIVAREDLTDAARFTVRGPVVTTDAKHGDSIAVNGVCLTVVDVLDKDSFTADVMQETLNARASTIWPREAVSTSNAQRRSTAASAVISCRGTSTAQAP